jgi:hypothetical protein
MYKQVKSYRALQAQAKSQSHQIGYLLLTQLIHSIQMQLSVIGRLVRLAAWMPSGDVRCSPTAQGGVMFRLLLRQRNGCRLIQLNLGLGSC